MNTLTTATGINRKINNELAVTRFKLKNKLVIDILSPEYVLIDTDFRNSKLLFRYKHNANITVLMLTKSMSINTFNTTNPTDSNHPISKDETEDNLSMVHYRTVNELLIRNLFNNNNGKSN